MKITRRQLNNLINETIKSTTTDVQFTKNEITFLKKAGINVNTSLNENPVIAAAGSVGLSLLTSMISTADGRNRLADILSAMPNLFISICNTSALLLGSKVGTVNPATAKIIKTVCKVFTYVNPLTGPVAAACTGVAALLRVIDDEQAKIITAEVGGSPRAGDASNDEGPVALPARATDTMGGTSY
jgi:hypothetical protein